MVARSTRVRLWPRLLHGCRWHSSDAVLDGLPELRKGLCDRRPLMVARACRWLLAGTKQLSAYTNHLFAKQTSCPTVVDVFCGCGGLTLLFCTLISFRAGHAVVPHSGPARPCIENPRMHSVGRVTTPLPAPMGVSERIILYIDSGTITVVSSSETMTLRAKGSSLDTIASSVRMTAQVYRRSLAVQIWHLHSQSRVHQLD